MNVSLTPQLEKFIHDKVATGRYQTASEVVREALRALEVAEERAADLQRVKEKIALGVAELDAGLGIPAEVAWPRIFARMEEAAQQKHRQQRASVTDAAAEPTIA